MHSVFFIYGLQYIQSQSKQKLKVILIDCLQDQFSYQLYRIFFCKLYLTIKIFYIIESNDGRLDNKQNSLLNWMELKRILHSQRYSKLSELNSGQGCLTVPASSGNYTSWHPVVPFNLNHAVILFKRWGILHTVINIF